MLRIVRGALRSRDLTKDLKSVALPLVLVQVRAGLVTLAVITEVSVRCVFRKLHHSS